MLTILAIAAIAVSLIVVALTVLICWAIGKDANRGVWPY